MSPVKPALSSIPAQSTPDIAQARAALDALAKMVSADPFGTGRKLQAARTVGNRLRGSIEQYASMVDELRKLEAGLGGIITEAQQVAAGTHASIVAPTKSAPTTTPNSTGTGTVAK